MIDWQASLRLAADVTLDRSLFADDARAKIAGWPIFQNVEHPIVASPLLLAADSLQEWKPRVEAYVRLLGRAIGLFRRHREIRDFYGLSSAACELIDAESEESERVRVCRLDGYVGGSPERLAILENNADSPAGTLFTPRLNALVRSLLGSHLERAGASDPFAIRPEAFLELLLEVHREHVGARASPFVAVFQIRGKENKESAAVAAALRERGVSAEVVDPREITWSKTACTVRGRAIDVVWNKINTVHWIPLLEESPQLVGSIAQTLTAGGACFVNSFGSRYVAESKLTLALLQDERFAQHFTSEERALVRELLPRTVKLERDTRVAGRVRLSELLLEEPHRWVLKEPYDIRGDGVTIGRSAPRSQWEELVRTRCDRGTVAQAFVQPPGMTVVLQAEGGTLRHWNFSVDCFVFDGKLAGFGGKASPNEKVNIYRGGVKLPVFVGK